MMREIETQYLENCGSAESPVWKFKGGTTYIVKNAEDIDLKEVFDLIEFRNDYAVEYVLTHREIVDEEETYELGFHNVSYLEKLDGEWIETRKHTSEGLRGPIVEVEEVWILGKGNNRTSYSCNYTLGDGSVISREEFIKKFVGTGK